MSVFSRIETFLSHYCPSSYPVLLALSGGPDSLCLFHCLLMYRKLHGLPFHIAHIDHSWREESRDEAEALEKLAERHSVPFHLKTLNPNQSPKCNIEAVFRSERYAFFAEICQKICFQAVLTGHHQDDQAETIFKRILEGAHWSRWSGLKPVSAMNGLRILRPLLKISKNEIREMLSREYLEAFEDPTNKHLYYLRARLRETIFPRLNQEFGKHVQKNFIEIGDDAQELTDFFERRLASLLDLEMRGPWGICLDWQSCLPETLLEIKYLLRLLCVKNGFFLSREIIEQSASALQSEKANKLYVMGSRDVWVDRKRMFIVHSALFKEKSGIDDFEILPGEYQLKKWMLKVEEIVYSKNCQHSTWKEAWTGKLTSYLPLGQYFLGMPNQIKSQSISLSVVKNRWRQAKIPTFLCSYFPLIWNETGICQDFLLGKEMTSLEEGKKCFKLDLIFS